MNKKNTAIMFGKHDVSDRIIIATDYVIAFPAKMPILPGHILLCPRRVVATFEDLTNFEKQELFQQISNLKTALKNAFGAEGFNIAWNEGEIAGQTVSHMHIHIVPRKLDDKGIVEYEPRLFLYRPGVRDISPQDELRIVSQKISKCLINQ